MSPSPCCQIRTPAPDHSPLPASPLRRGRGLVAWVLPTVVLTFLPKCPACLAAYVALLTGVGISLPAATFLRTALAILCLSALLFLAVKRLQKFLHRHPTRSN